VLVPVLVSVTAIRPDWSAIGTVSNVEATLKEALSVPPLMYAVSDADVLGDGETDGGADGEGEAGDGEAGEVGDADGEGDGDGPGCWDPGPPEPVPATRCPAGMRAEPVVTSVRAPTGGGAGAGTGGRWPFSCPGTAPARVAEAGT
jgi:hypothetical protein